jgi:dihydrolipoamide dehydrogenase
MSATLTPHTVVIGSGPGGYVCAIRLAQLGVDTVLVERQALGGVCLNVGCIPSKALITASKLVSQIREATAMGIHVAGLRVDLGEMMAFKQGIVGKLTAGVGQLVEGNGGRILRGTARFLDPRSLEVTGEDGETTRVVFDSAVIATGSVPAEIPGFAFDAKRVVSSTEALALAEIPERLAIVGGGYIGMELGGVYQRLGTQVTVIEFLDRILPGFDKDLVRPVERRFKAAGGKILTKTKALGWLEAPGGGLVVEMVAREGNAPLPPLATDVVLMTVGRRPFTASLALDKAGVQLDERGFVPVDGAQRTNVRHIYAIGDVAGEPMLAHKASREGEVAAEVIAGGAAAFDARAIPAVVFTDPEIATVGLSEAQAREAGRAVVAGKFAFAANGRALSLGDSDGFVRVVMDAETHAIVGVQIVGPEASNLIAEAGLAVEMGALAEDVGATIHAHPTLAEALMEAAKAALGHAVHAMNRRR